MKGAANTGTGHDASRRRVAIFMPTPPSQHGGGAERVMMGVADGLAQRGFAVDFLVNRMSSACWGTMPPEVRLRSLHTWRYTCLPGLLKYIAREQPNALLTTMKSANLTALIAKKFFAPKLRLVIHQASPFSGEFGITGARQRLAMRGIKWLMPTADAIVALNHNMAADMEEVAPRARDRVVVIHDPFDIDDIVARSRCPVEHPWLTEGRSAPVIVTAARLHPKKDLSTLLRAFAVVVKQRPARLIILGEGPELELLTDLAARLEIDQSTDFAGFKANPFPFMARADLFALSSVIEGFGGVLVQAMACGTPVVSTNCPFGPWEILADGELGRLSPVGDHEGLARSIVDTLDNPIAPERLVAGARRYSAESTIDAYVEALGLSQCISPAPSHPGGS